jgi:hypothetical protein
MHGHMNVKFLVGLYKTYNFRFWNKKLLRTGEVFMRHKYGNKNLSLNK